MNPKALLVCLTKLIQGAPAGGPLHHATIMNATSGIGGGAFTLVIEDAVYADENTRYLVSFTKLV